MIAYVERINHYDDIEYASMLVKIKPRQWVVMRCVDYESTLCIKEKGHDSWDVTNFLGKRWIIR